MLLNFSIGGFWSYRESQTLNLLASSQQTSHATHLMSGPNDTQVLPAAVLYGANAAGKSAIVKGLLFLKNLLQTGVPANGTIPVPLFRLAAPAPARLEVQLAVDGKIFQYGMAVLPTEIVEEWLFVQGARGEIKIFERTNKDGRARVEKGEGLGTDDQIMQRVDLIAQNTLVNQPFLHKLGENGVQPIQPVLDWFSKTLQIMTPTSVYPGLHARALNEPEFLSYLGQILKDVGTGIETVKVSEDIVEPKQLGLPPELLSLLEQGEAPWVSQFLAARSMIRKPDGKFVRVKLNTMHASEEGGEVPFETHHESDGTQRMLQLGPAIFDLSSKQHVYVIDELDRSLHPLLVRFLVELFLFARNCLGAQSQLIFTTHDTHILDQDLLRRDEIWFVEKDKGGASHLTSLEDYNIRKDLRIEKGYLQGRFGAIPFLTSDIQHLIPKRDA